MDDLDLRQVGVMFGHKLYIDLADMPNLKEKDELLTTRDVERLRVRETLKKAFGMDNVRGNDD